VEIIIIIGKTHSSDPSGFGVFLLYRMCVRVRILNYSTSEVVYTYIIYIYIYIHTYYTRYRKIVSRTIDIKWYIQLKTIILLFILLLFLLFSTNFCAHIRTFVIIRETIVTVSRLLHHVHTNKQIINVHIMYTLYIMYNV